MLISSHLQNIVRLIQKNATVSIISPTGTGKSIAVPAGIAATGARVFVTVPTKTSAISLSSYQSVLQKASNPGIDVSKLVGYAEGGNVHYGPETLIAYVTAGHARNLMLSYFSKGVASSIDFCDVLMVDEIHSGSLDTTEIVSLWMTAASQGVLVPRLVVASATPVPMIIEPEPAVYKVEIPAFPIEFRYLDKDIDIDDPNGAIYTKAASIANDIHRNTDINTGHILIFGPGSGEVESIAASLQELLKVPPAGKIATIIPAFGALKQEDIARIYKDTAANERKIVIATNIAEMSITIADVGYVVDTLTEKRSETSQSGGFRLSTHYISKDSAKQRAGRTGRTRPGICYRLCTETKFNSLEQHRPPEIERVPIYELVMGLLDVGLSPEAVIKELAPERISQAVRLLQQLGMVANTPTGIVVTEMGHFAPKVHISVRNAAFLWNWIQSKYPVFPGIVAAVLIDSYGPSYFWIPRRKPEMSMEEYNVMASEHKAKYFAKYLGYNDLETSLNMWHDLVTSMGGIKVQQKTLVKWARDNSINNKKIRELLKIVEQCVNAVSREGFDVQIGPFTTQGVMTAARPILLSVYSDNTFIHRRDSTYFSPITREEYRLDNRDAVNGLSQNPPKGVIALATAEIKTQRGAFRVIGFAVDTDKDGLGRPIVERGQARTPRGPRAIVRTRREVTETISPMATNEINQALDLLQGLVLGVDTPQIELAPTVNIPQINAPTIPVSIDREYTRYWYIDAMQNNIQGQLSTGLAYEALNSLERWLIGLANIPSTPDPIFSIEKLGVDHPLSIIFATELEKKKIANAGIIVGTCIAIATQFLELANFEQAPDPVREGNNIIVGSYVRILPPGRIDILLQKGDLVTIASMALRYSCLLPRGQQWNIPRPVYDLMVNKYGVVVEGFGSPINSQIIAINPNLKFCSLFLDTDYQFGSLGSFFDQKFDNVKVMANPPFIENLMNDMARFLTRTFNDATNLMCVCVVPAWLDAEYYQELSAHPYLKASIELPPRAHYYVNSSENDARISASFASRVFVLSKGFPDLDYNELQREIRAIYTK